VDVRCGEGPTEKERATATSPAAYSTHETMMLIKIIGLCDGVKVARMTEAASTGVVPHAEHRFSLPFFLPSLR